VHYLSADQKYKIGFKHYSLLKLLRTMDNTIDFMIKQRQAKACFFTDLRSNLYQHNCIELTQRSLQQLLFLDDRLYEIEWQYHEKCKRPDLQLRLPAFKSEDERVWSVRTRIV
jgi:hypothetical protein